MKAIITVVGIIIVIGASFYFGAWWGESKNPVSLTDQFGKFSNSSLLQSATFVVQGKVSGIEGNKLILTKEGENLSVNMAQDAVISLVLGKNNQDGTFSYQASQTDFNSIILGDEVAITVLGSAEEGLDLLGKAVTIKVSPGQ